MVVSVPWFNFERTLSYTFSTCFSFRYSSEEIEVVVQIVKLLLQLFFPCSYFCTLVLHLETEELSMVCTVLISNKLIDLVPRKWLLSVNSRKHRSTKKLHQKVYIHQTFSFPLFSFLDAYSSLR